MIHMAKVGELAEQIRGVTFTKDESSSQPAPGLVAVLRAGNIQNGRLIFTDLVFVPAHKVRDRQIVRRNDVVIATSSGSLTVVGKAARSLTDFDGGFGAFLKVLRPGPEIDPGYFAHYFQTPTYRSRISSLASGANINNLKQEHLDNLEIPFPPIADQRHIAAILDHADALRIKRHQVLTKFETFFQSIFHEMFGPSGSHISGASKESIGNLLRIKSGSFLSAKQQNPGPFPVFGGNGVTGYHSEYLLKEQKIVMGRVGAYCGAVHLTPPCSWVTDNALYVSELKREFSLIYLRDALVLANLNQYASRSGQPLISASRIKDVLITVPSASAQTIYENRILAGQHQRQCAERQLIIQEKLFNSLQSRAFAGQL